MLINKTKILIGIFLLVLFVYPSTIHAAEPNYFRPNVQIPGMHAFFDGAVKDESLSTTSSIVYKYPIDNSGIIRYIQAVYSYSAILAGVIAMFMLVFAAYQWMLAAGNAEKIGRARDTISGVLLGLTLLFGGYLLLSQISDRLVDLKPIAIKPIVPIIPPPTDQCTLKNTTQATCENSLGCIWAGGICKTDPNTPTACNLTREQVEASSVGIYCCQHNAGQSSEEYVYAKGTFNQNYCDEICDNGIEGDTWTNKNRSFCTAVFHY